MLTTEESKRFWSMIHRINDASACWEWHGHTIKGGYGDFRVREGGGWRHWISHRLAWSETNGPIPDGKMVLHLCDNPPCCNPAHLILGSHQDNMDDMARKMRKVVFKGESNVRSKLTKEDVLEIRRLVNVEHRSRSRVAALFRVDRRTVSKIASGDDWAHIPLDAPAWHGRAKSSGRPRRQEFTEGKIRCGRCGEVKPFDAYSPSCVKRGNGYCRACMSRWGHERRAAREPERATP